MDKLALRVALRFAKLPRSGGGIDVQEDVLRLLPSLAASTHTMDSKDVAHATYVFDILASLTQDHRIRSFYNVLATTYAQRFADWLGYVFLNRANLTRRSKDMKALEEGLSAWVQALPDMLHGHPKSVEDFLPVEARGFLDGTRLNSIGAKVLKVLAQDFHKGTKNAETDLSGLPISFNKHTRLYEIPKSSLTYTNRAKLKDLGFKFDGHLWTTPTLETEALKELPQVAHLHEGTPPPPQEPPADVREWFFHTWLPKNISRFGKVFDDYGRAEGVPYSFTFLVHGETVEVSFKRNIRSLPEAIHELKARYGGAGDREGWMKAVESYEELMSAHGNAAMAAVDKANNLEHSHGAMMEHFPPGVRAWYPAFLDFKYTASPWQMVNAIEDEDLRVVASELMPLQFRMHRLVPEKTDERTPKGLALEISAQPGKPAKKKMLQIYQKAYPDMYPKVVQLLEERGLHLT